MFLVAMNNGLRHEVIRDIVLATHDGEKLNTVPKASPYILAGAIRRWPITAEETPLSPGETLQLTANGEAGAIEQQVSVVEVP